MQFGQTRQPNPVAKLQTALETLSRRVNDHTVATTLDGKMGPLTAQAVNSAMRYTSAPPELKTGRLTQAQVVAQIATITAYIENARPAVSAVVSSSPAGAPPVVKAAVQQTTMPTSAPIVRGGATMPAYYPQPLPGYYPPQPYYAQTGPGGLPTDRASLDVKAFIPAQYQHVRVSPGGVALVLAAGVIVVLLVNKKKEK
jgi:hypothetical protein